MMDLVVMELGVCFGAVFAGSFRSEVRNKYNLSEEPCSDCLVHFFCSPCAVCQEARELKVRD